MTTRTPLPKVWPGLASMTFTGIVGTLHTLVGVATLHPHFFVFGAASYITTFWSYRTHQKLIVKRTEIREQNWRRWLAERPLRPPEQKYPWPEIERAIGFLLEQRGEDADVTYEDAFAYLRGEEARLLQDDRNAAMHDAWDRKYKKRLQESEAACEHHHIECYTVPPGLKNANRVKYICTDCNAVSYDTPLTVEKPSRDAYSRYLNERYRGSGQMIVYGGEGQFEFERPNPFKRLR